MVKRINRIVLYCILCFLFCGCSAQEEKNIVETKTIEVENIQTDEGEEMNRQLTLTINGAVYDVTLYDTQAANALYEMLPLDLTFEDFNGIEKIAYLSQTLPTDKEPDGFEPHVGDLCLYAPWGNLSIFYQDFRYSDSLISLGHIDSGMDVITNLPENTVARLEIK